MSEEHALVVVAGYQDLDSANHDFDTLPDRAKDKSVALRGAVLVGKDAVGNHVVVDTGNRLGRRGTAWGAGVGLAVGLFSPALLASAAAGAVAGTFADHRIKTGLADKIGQALAAGGAVIIAVVSSQGRLAVEQALTRVAQNGLSYNCFHVTAVCSLIRAAPLTGRNHHRVGFGSVCEFRGPFPGYSSVKPRSCAALSRILRDNGYVLAVSASGT